MKFRINYLFSVAGLLTISVGLAAPVRATADNSSSNVKQLKQSVDKAKSACAGDIKKLCSDVNPGEGRVLDCLSAKEDQLTAGCAAARGKAQAQVSKAIDRADVAFRRDCGSDVQKYCSDVPSGKGRVLNCLSKHEDGLSNSCKDFEAKLSTKLDEYWG